MFLLYLSIPVMILAVAVATVPLIHAMRLEAAEHRRARARAHLAHAAGSPAGAVAEDEPIAA